MTEQGGIVLASASPRRVELLESAGIAFTVIALFLISSDSANYYFWTLPGVIVTAFNALLFSPVELLTRVSKGDPTAMAWMASS